MQSGWVGIESKLKSMKYLPYIFIFLFYEHCSGQDSINFHPKIYNFDGYLNMISVQYEQHWYSTVIFSQNKLKYINFKVKKGKLFLFDPSYKIIYWSIDVPDKIEYLYPKVKTMSEWLSLCPIFDGDSEVVGRVHRRKYRLASVRAKFDAFEYKDFPSFINFISCTASLISSITLVLFDVSGFALTNEKFLINSIKKSTLLSLISSKIFIIKIYGSESQK
jgi:hypothetical protein